MKSHDIEGVSIMPNQWGSPEISGPPLDAAMDNVLAWRLADAWRVAAEASVGDSIDRGLALLRGLNEQGFDVLATGEQNAGLFPGRKKLSQESA
jgi:hypothetical protein